MINSKKQQRTLLYQTNRARKASRAIRLLELNDSSNWTFTNMFKICDILRKETGFNENDNKRLVDIMRWIGRTVRRYHLHSKLHNCRHRKSQTVSTTQILLKEMY